MMKNRLAVAFAFVGLLGLAACGGEEDTQVIEEPVVEEPTTAPAVEPTMETEPMVTDTTTMELTDTGTVQQ